MMIYLTPVPAEDCADLLAALRSLELEGADVEPPEYPNTIALRFHEVTEESYALEWAGRIVHAAGETAGRQFAYHGWTDSAWRARQILWPLDS